MAEEQGPSAEEGEKQKPSKLKLIIIVVLALVVVGGGGAAGAWFFLSGDDAQEEVAPAETVKAEAIYTKIRTMNGKPMFVVTLQSDDNRPHYMQLYVEAKSREQDVADALTLHMPLIVSRLNNLFSTQDFRVLQTLEGKQALRESATDLVRELMQEKIAKPGVEAILFTNMVMQ
ncbi:flagellar basal body-associated FliL family protein [Neptuniibacter pectenicola]|jgi:flagellar FliL protein|uniref:Flagellar protein FliL n=1 Tax=Neptuniibacter pectenicola TaxID=1806669 RepID=A0ABU9TSF9_9GAMM|nr:flagellar basal body-associated FliL family protein [Neptuniibacter pectenicola]|tara:strand:+ start:3266 stop:3787 length:522 start_codon:yes stop_codon:yes gene_type:complete